MPDSTRLNKPMKPPKGSGIARPTKRQKMGLGLAIGRPGVFGDGPQK